MNTVKSRRSHRKTRVHRSPPFMRGRIRQFVVMLLVLISVLITLVIALPMMGAPAWTIGLVWLFYAPALVWMITRFVGQYRQIQKRLAAGELPCWACGYDVSAHVDGGVCPECGERFEQTALRETWAKALSGDIQMRPAGR